MATASEVVELPAFLLGQLELGDEAGLLAVPTDEEARRVLARLV